MLRLQSLALTLTLATTAGAQGLGAVYTLTNGTVDNRVAVTLRLPNGGLVPFREFSTGGTGTGTGLGSQGALTASPDGLTLLAVSAGSDEVTLFRVIGGVYLWRQDTEPSGGDRPTSVALHDRLVYVLNADSDTVTGFHVHAGELVPIAGATYGLSQSAAAGGQVGFSPDGTRLVVTERATHRIAVYPVLPDGTLAAGQFYPSAGQTPFGFVFRDDGTLVVTEAAGGAPGASTVSTYRIVDGALQTITAAVATHQASACWVALPRNGRFAYSANTAAGTISSFELNPAGALTLLEPSGVAGDFGPDGRPGDLDFDRHGRFLFVLDSAADRIETFQRHDDGSLVRLGAGRQLDDGAAGLVAN